MGAKAMSEAELLEKARKIVREFVEPALFMQGGSIEVVGLDGRILQVRMVQSCGSCPSTIRAVLFGIEEELRVRLPEIDFVEALP
ncbi:MAG: NifU family protein [Gemmataceae bacterium]|nr:NifU family protein [Gemmataceae bacterium]